LGEGNACSARDVLEAAVEARNAAVLRASYGKVTCLRHYFDVMHLVAQLGLLGIEARV